MKKLLLILPVALVLGSCTRYHLASGDRAHDRMAYAQATHHYERALGRIEDRDAALRAADAFQRQHQMGRAAQWFAHAERISELRGHDALRYGQVLQGLGRNEQATLLFERALTDDPADAIALGLWQAAERRQEFFVDTTLFTLDPLNIEGMTGVFAVVPHRDGIVFAGERAAKAGRGNPWNGNSFIDLYTAKPLNGGAWSRPEPLPGTVNGRFHDGPAVFSTDGREMYFTRSDYYKFRLNKDEGATSHLKLFRAQRDPNGNWGEIHQFAYNTHGYSTGHAAMSTDGNTLYFVSDRPGGYGGTDIYRCQRLEEGWSEPVNLGPVVNTAGNEMFPTISGDSLFFSSDGHPGIGGLDIFLTTPVADGWTTPANMNYPINSTSDDFALVMSPGGTDGYLSSDRSGRDKAYTFQGHEPTLVVHGIFLNDETGEPMPDVEVRLLDLTTGEAMTMLTGPDGHYRFDMKKDSDYRLSGSKNGMFTESRDISTQGQRVSRTWTENFELKEVVIEKPILVENIYYDYDRWDIRADAAAELDKLARIFIDNPNLSFELSSHTDSRASDLYNLVLSEARANSAVDYLIRKGVGPDRIVAKGYGERRLVNHCRDGVECTEEEHQANRRTEFKVTKVTPSLP
ncbi:MAG: OmpA family protein [Flavobacteriales bacterium]|nr:OmpA family protein [Flavobacteriales bacterium]